MTPTLGHFLTLGAMLFAMAVIGIFLNRKNLIVLLMAIELMLLAVNMNFVAFSHYLGDMHGQVFVFFILTVAAAESAIGLAILVLLFRNKSNINADALDTPAGLRRQTRKVLHNESNLCFNASGCPAGAPWLVLCWPVFWYDLRRQLDRPQAATRSPFWACSWHSCCLQ